MTSRAHIWLRRIRLILTFFFVALVAIVAGALIVVSTSWGGERLRRMAESKVNEAVKGNVSIERLRFGLIHLVVKGVQIRDPDSEIVAEIPSADVRIALFPLIHKTIRVTGIELIDPRLNLEQDERGLNLARAFEPRTPSQKTAPANTRPTTWQLELDELAIRRGAIAFTNATGGSLEKAGVENLDLSVRLKAGLDFEAFDTSVKIDARVTEPLTGPFSVRLTAQGHGESRKGDLKLTLSDAELKVTGEMSGSQNIKVHLETLKVPPDLAHAIVATYPLIQTVELKGDVEKVSDLVKAELTVSAGRARAALNAKVDTSRLEAQELLLRGDGIDPSELLRDGPRARLALDLKARGGGRSLESAHGELSFRVTKSAVGEVELGPIRLEARANRGKFQLSELFAQVPGLLLQATGEGTTERLRLEGMLEARDLSKLSRILGQLGLGQFALAGAGRLDFRVDGKVKNPGISVNGAFSRLAFQDNELQSLTVSARLPEVSKPLEAQAKLDVQSVKVLNRRRGPIHVLLTSENRQFSFKLTDGNPVSESLLVGGTLDPDRTGIRLTTLNLDYVIARTVNNTVANWRLEKPAHVRFSGAFVSVEDFRLVSGNQSIAMNLRKAGPLVDGNVSLGNFDLSRLPPELVGNDLNLGGRIDTSIHLKGSTNRPNVTVSFELKEGRIRRYAGLGAKLQAHYSHDRAEGTFSAAGQGLNIDSRFLVPIGALLRGLKEPVEVTAQVKEIDLGQVLPNFGFRESILGSAYAKLKLHGMANDPRIEATVGGNRIIYRQLPSTDFTVTARSQKSGALEAEVQAKLLQRTNSVVLKTPFNLGRLIRKPPTTQQLLHAVYELQADIQQLPVPLPYIARLSDKPLLGNVSAKAQMRGSPLAPIGTAEVLVEQLTSGSSRAVDAKLNLFARANELEARLVARHDQENIAQIEAKLLAAPAQITTMKALASAPVLIRARVGPLVVKDLQQIFESDTNDWGAPREIQILNGTVAMNLDAQGSLGDPRINLVSEIKGLGIEKGDASGDINLAYQYQKGQNQLTGFIQPNTGGRMEITASTQLDLSYPAIQKLAVMDAAINGNLTADNLNLAFLSGVIPQVVQLEATLHANATFKGKPISPVIEGAIDLKGRRLLMNGFGDFRDIHLALKGDRNRIDLSDLSVKAGTGNLRMKMLATRQGQGYALKGDAEVKKFPIISQDQLLATLTTNTKLEGNVSSALIDFTKIDIPEAHIELPDVKRKNLQPLAEAKNITFIRNGKLVTRGKPAEAQGIGGSGTASSTADARTIRANIIAPRNLWVRGNDINVEVGLNDGFRVEYVSDPNIYGQLNIIRGRADVYGRRFDLVKDSKMNFAGTLDNVLLDISAKNVNEVQQIAVFVRVSGGLSSLKIEPTSEPPLSQTEILTLLATGRTSLRPGTGTASSSGGAASIIGSFAAGELKKSLSQALPLDVLSIEAGDKGLQGTKLEAGTYVGTRLYLGFTGRIGADPYRLENTNAVHLEYQLSKRWSLGAEYGDARKGGADLFWNKEY